jgi:hypothetical protein
MEYFSYKVRYVFPSYCVYYRTDCIFTGPIALSTERSICTSSLGGCKGLDNVYINSIAS